jgi:hypothetical protein
MANALGVRFNATSTGTGDFVDASAVTGYRRGASILVDGSTYRYRAENSSLSEYEWGTGVWTSSSSTLARTTIFASSTGSKVSFTSVPQVAVTIFPADLRELLTAARTYYVRTDGSDSNTGLANTAGGAFLTIQKAVDTVSALDIAGNTITIQIADGTYTATVALKNVPGFASLGNLIIQGNNATPANVIISTTSADCFSADTLSSVWDIKDLKMQTTTSGACLAPTNGSCIRFGNVNFGTTAGSHVYCLNRGYIVTLSNYAISGAASIHWLAYHASQLVCIAKTITITGTPAFSLFADCEFLSTMNVHSNTFSGSATGPRYQSYSNSIIFTNGGGATYLPGNAAAGTPTATGGLYL